ncbi:MarR family transcriptional regulator [Nocardia sp. NBC_01388]
MLMARYQVLTQRRPGQQLERSAYVLLSRLELEGPLSVRQLTEAFGLDTSTVNRQTGALLRAGLVERIPDVGGGLARKLRITSAAKTSLAADRELYQSRIGLTVADWSQDEIEELVRSLAHFNRSVEMREGLSWPPSPVEVTEQPVRDE